jgi:membrane-associated phospholipid phosphatase
MWSRLNKRWRPLLIGYPLLMMFTLAYAGEHYVTDGIAGALCALLIHWAVGRIERWHKARRAPDTLEPQPDPMLESECPSTAMTPSST